MLLRVGFIIRSWYINILTYYFIYFFKNYILYCKFISILRFGEKFQVPKDPRNIFFLNYNKINKTVIFSLPKYPISIHTFFLKSQNFQMFKYILNLTMYRELYYKYLIRNSNFYTYIFLNEHQK